MQFRHDVGPFLSGVSNRFIGISTVFSLSLFVSSGCGTAPLPSSETGPSPSTLSETVTPEPPETDGDDVLIPAGIEQMPSLSFEAGPGFCCNPLAIEFRVTPSDSDDFVAASYQWDFGDGRTGTGVSTNHTYTWQGEYLVILTLTTSDGLVIEVAQTLVLGGSTENGGITLVPGTDPAPPDDTTGTDASGGLELTVDAGNTVTAFAGDEVFLNGTADTGGQAVELDFMWRQLAGQTVSVTDPSHASTSLSIPSNIVTPAALLYELTATSGEVTASDQVTIVVSATPVQNEVNAHAGADRTVPAGSVVQLDGGFSTGTGEEPLTFHWSQSAGPVVALSDASSPTPSFVAPEAEASTIRLQFDLTVTQGAVSAQDDINILIASIDTPDEAQVLAWMRELEPLQKVHFSWDYPPGRLFTPIEDILFEYVRITHAISIRGESAHGRHVGAAVEACAQVNALSPSIPATIAIHYSPWHRVFPPDAPPTDFGPFHDEEVDLFRTRMFTVRDLIATANASRGQDVEVSYLVLDSERFWVKKGDTEGAEAWNSAMNEKYNVIYQIGKEVFPDATIEWYSRGTINHFTLQEMGDTISQWIYSIPYEEHTRRKMQLAYDIAQENGASIFTTWVALNVGFDVTDDANKHWASPWDYDVAISWQTGAKLNDPSYFANYEEAAPWRAADPIVLYPRPFSSDLPNWGKHFVAYVRGAHGIAELP